jgi:hypothetical protein
MNRDRVEQEVIEAAIELVRAVEPYKSTILYRNPAEALVGMNRLREAVRQLPAECVNSEV